MTTTEREQALQELMDARGYVIIAYRWQHPIGEVLRNCEYGNGDQMPVVVVTGYTTEDDFISQVMESQLSPNCQKMGTKQVRAELGKQGYSHFHKVVAE